MRGLGYLGNASVGMVEKPKPELNDPTGALIRITATAPCTTDVHAVENNFYPQTGNIIGHEAVGIVEEVGKYVKHIKPGDRVVCPDIVPIYDSDEGMAGIGNQVYGKEFSMRSADPALQGMLTEYMLYPRADIGLAVVPDSISDEVAVMLADMIPTAATGVEYMDIQLGETVAVLGIGPVGLMGIELATLQGASRIFASGSRPATFEAAKKLGATDLIDYHNGSISEQMISLNGGPVDKVLIAGGNSGIITEGFNVCRMGGKIACVAAFFDVAPENASVFLKNWDKEYRNLYYYADRLRLKRWLRLIEYGRLHPEHIITHVLRGIDKLPEAYELIAKKEADTIKPVVLL